jgi:hypothetical protein
VITRFGFLVRLGRGLYRISDAVLITVGLAALASSPFYHLATVRAHLIGSTVAPPFAAPAVLCLGLGLALRSLLRRDFVWQDPAKLTWSDGTDGRIGTIGRRLWGSWAVRCVLVAYATAGGAALFAGSPNWVLAGLAAFVAVAALAVVAARRTASVRIRWAEQLASLILPLVGSLLAVQLLPSSWLWGVAAVALVSAIALLFRSGLPLRPAVASQARRGELVEQYNVRLVRRMSVAFLDLLSLLPGPSTLTWSRLFAGPAIVLRFVLGGMFARRAGLLLSLLLVWAVAVVHLVFPLLSTPWLVGIAGYFAALPFAAVLAKLNQQPGLRRWLGCTDLDLRLTTAGLVVVVMAIWLALVLAFGVPADPQVLLAALLASAAVIRTATRPAFDYGNVGITTTPDGNMVPFGLVVQLVRGPEVLLIGLYVANSSLPPNLKPVVCLAIAAFAFVR